MSKIKNNIVLLLPLIPIWIITYKYLQEISDFIVFRVFQMTPEKHLTEAVRFFIYEVPKVLMLLVLIIFIVGIIRTYFSPEKTRKALEGKSLFTGNVMASLLGIVTPFCSCSAIPLFLGFVEAGIPLGVTFSFLIAAPMINEVALILLIGLFGWKVAVIYVLTGLSIAIFAGFILEKLKLQRYVADWVYKTHAKQTLEQEEALSFSQRISAGGAGFEVDALGFRQVTWSISPSKIWPRNYEHKLSPITSQRHLPDN